MNMIKLLKGISDKDLSEMASTCRMDRDRLAEIKESSISWVRKSHV
jgi:hypothetical protein